MCAKEDKAAENGSSCATCLSSNTQSSKFNFNDSQRNPSAFSSLTNKLTIGAFVRSNKSIPTSDTTSLTS